MLQGDHRADVCINRKSHAVILLILGLARRQMQGRLAHTK
jgi:hypothetical protein